MNNVKLFKHSILHSVAAVLYISGIAALLSNGEKFFGNEKSMVIPIFMLLLLVLSASIMGLLIFGRPIMLYLDGLKKEAVKLLFYTIGCLFLFTLVFSIILILLKK